MALIKPEHVDDFTQDWDGCRDIMKKDSDESESGNELENPVFVTVKEEPVDETLLDQGTFDLDDSAEGSNTDTNRLPRYACCASTMLHLESQNSCHHSNSIGAHEVNPEACLIENRTQCLSNITLKKRSLPESEVPLGIECTSKIERGIRERVDKEGKMEQSGEKQMTEMGNEKSVYKNRKSSLEKLSIAGDKGKQRCPLNTSSKPMLQLHSGKETYKCSQCTKTFNKKSKLNIHMRTHTGERPFKCNQCGKAFNQSCNLKTHLRLHTGEKLFTCNWCGKSFNRNDHLTIHIRQHTGEKPFKCIQCGKSFNKSYHLTIHMQQHTGEQMFKCIQCGKSFKRSHNLTIHKRQHTGEKPFKCSHCGKSFSSSSCLIIHIRHHTGEKPFKCSQCEKSYSKSGSLTIHMRQHSGERPFKCNVCSKAFADKGVLKRHMQTHTSN